MASLKKRKDHYSIVFKTRLDGSGKVGTGFSDKKLQEIYSLLSGVDETEKPEFAPASKGAIWVEPIITAEISYNEINPNGTFRAPVFERVKT